MSAKRFIWYLGGSAALTALLWSVLLIWAVRSAPNVEESWVEPVQAIKKRSAASKTGRRLFYVSGSSGMYGVDTPTFERVTGVPVQNMGTFGGLGLEGMCDDLLEVAHPGDAVLLAFENDLYAFDPFHENLVRHTLRCHPQKLYGDGLSDLPGYLFSLSYSEIRDRWIYRSRVLRGQPVSANADAFVKTVNESGDQVANVGSPRKNGKLLGQDQTLKPPAPEALRRLQKNLRRLQDRGLTIFATTQPKLLSPDFDAAQVNQMREVPAEVYDRNRVDYFTHSFSASVDEFAFYDSDNHLNRDGALRYSEDVATKLRARPTFVAWKESPGK